MIGMNRHTGRQIDGPAHLGQSLMDLLTTPIGSRVMRRTYGSRLPEIIDQPMNGETLVDLYVSVAEAIQEWEPRIDLVQITVAEARPGYVALDLTDETGQVIPLEIDLLQGAAQ